MKSFLLTVLFLFFGLSAFADEYCTITQIFYGNNVHRYTENILNPVSERIRRIGDKSFTYEPDGQLWKIDDDSVLYRNGKIVKIGSDRIRYNPDGTISQIGDKNVYYNNGRVVKIGGDSVRYWPSGEILKIGDDSVSYQEMKD
jgi:hypothetical protein